MIEFKYTILYVNSVAKTLEFYADVFNFEPLFITPEGDYGELNTGSVKLAFASHKLASTNLTEGFTPTDTLELPAGFELGFVTDQVEVLVEKALKHGAILVEEAIVKEWGQTVAYIRDINGLLIEICTPIG